ncbi:hypothetical protein LCER1_G007543 [Lachnellula cervina]|uniref:Uncharacterized protein n=1 Tax=Lachnellula cervina TaxID=1316786 RepID=A0A7D8YJB9_9HELO|nr:hypothetical protein LCER1_G007543 [Lachnellula cervina]
MLTALSTRTSQVHHPTSLSRIKVPCLHFFIQDTEANTNTIILEDIQDAVDLKSLLVSPSTSPSLSHTHATSTGYSLGSWLRSYHAWISSPSSTPSALCSAISTNSENMRRLKHDITYNIFIEIIAQFPEVTARLTGGERKSLEDVKEMADGEFDRKVAMGDDSGEWGIIHGDFWTGNILLSPAIPSQQPTEEPEPEPEPLPNLFIIDWESTQFGHRAYDIGQMIGDLLERQHFSHNNSNGDAAVLALEGFIDGYGAVSEEMAFRIAVHAGVQLVTWVARGPPLHMRPAWATRERVVGIVEMGVRFILRGWGRDREWIGGSVLKGLVGDV